MFHKILVWTLFTTLNWNGIAWAASSPLPQKAAAVTYNQVLVSIDPVTSLLYELRQHIDKSQFDLEALIDKLDYDADEITRFVTHEIYFEQYPGLLRGARGTLMSRAGNALDQAVLLATLLKDSGYEARIARTTLPADQATMLLDQMKLPRKSRLPVGDMEAIAQVMKRIAALSAMTEEQVAQSLIPVMNPVPVESTEMYRTSQKDTEFILARLGEAAVVLGDPDQRKKLIEEARDYFWVQYRSGPSKSWDEVHPGFAEGNGEPSSLKIATLYASKIPEALQHRFRFHASIEVEMGGQTTEKSLMAAWERPVTNLIGEPLTFTNFPDSFVGSSTAEEIRDAISKSRGFLPMFNQHAAGQNVFDLSGNVVPADAALSPFASVFRTGADKVADALGELSGMGGDTSKLGADGNALLPVLKEQWLEYTLIAPGGEETVYRRAVLDHIKASIRNGPDGKAALASALTAEHTFMLALGSFPDAYLMDRITDRLIMTLPVMAMAKIKSIDPDVTIQISENEMVGMDTRWLGHLFMYRLFDLKAIGEDRGYRPEPTLVLHRTNRPDFETPTQVIDIINNTRRSLAWSVAGSGANVAAMIQSGVWETHAESMMSGASLKPVFNTMIAMQKAKEIQIPISVYLPTDANKVDQLPLSQEARLNLQRDLASGFAVILPEAMPFGMAQKTAWWRVNPMSGETLGIASDGRGTITMEDLNLRLIAKVLLPVLGIGLGISCGAYYFNKGRIQDKGWDCIGIAGGTAVLPFSSIAAGLILLAISALDVLEVPFGT